MSEPVNSRSVYWDLVKGLGIITIILGHSCYFAVAFVYLFHLALFFFITGYFYNEKKYGDSPFFYFGARLAGAWPRYIVYTSVFVLLHNLFVTHGLYEGQELYNHTRMLQAALSGVSFNCPEQIQGALWFLPVWLVSSALFGGTVWFGRLAARLLAKERLKVGVIALSSFLLGAAGVFLNMRKCSLPYNLQAAFLVVPLYFLAWMLRLHLPEFKKYTTWYGCLISAFLLYQINHTLHIYIELASMNIPGFWFYPISLLGIYFLFSLAALLEKVRPCARLLALLGRYSFDIMALHFTLFKLIDWVYARFWLQEVPDNLAQFPISFTHELWPFYLVLGALIPTLLGFSADRLLGRLLTPGKRTHS